MPQAQDSPAAPPRPAGLPSRQDIVTNLRRISVQAGLIGGAVTAGVGGYQAFVASTHHHPGVVTGLLALVVGIGTGAGVYFGRQVPQPNLSQ